MSFPICLAAALVAATATMPGPRPAPAAKDRTQVPDRYKWKLSDLFPSDDAWAEGKARLAKNLEGFARHQGHLADGPKALGDALSDMGALQSEAQRISVYAQSRSDEDTRQAKPRGMRAEAERLAVALDAATSWVRPELLAMPADRIKSALAQEPRLRDWAFYLEDVVRWKPHTLGAEEERIVAMTGDLAGTGGTIHGILTDADLPYPTVKLSTGEAIRLDPSGYTRARTTPARADRIKVFQGFFGALKGYERTLGAALYAQVQAHGFEKDVHRFGSSLESALFRDDIPVEVYRRLVKDVNANLPTLHRYLRLRQRILGLHDLRYEDLYTPLAKGIGRRYTIDQGIAMTLAAVAPLGRGYQAKLQQGFQIGWTDFLPAQGKRSGAYSTGVYGVHPYQLLNYNGQWEDVSTLAHESGHSMHTLLSFENQPFPTSSYAIFVAEVASTLNEDLLFHSALDAARDDGERLALLGDHLESLRTTIFRQAAFAEFELLIHDLAEKGEALTGEKLSVLYLDLVRRHHGHDAGVCKVPDLYGVEWTFIPHFYYDFYVYQYATSMVASSALAKAIREDEARGGTAARDRYLAMLSSGSSKYPMELLKDAGVDMTTSAPFTAALEDMSATMDRIEAILSRQKRGGARAD